jgi:hypothetical protein
MMARQLREPDDLLETVTRLIALRVHPAPGIPC